MDLRFNLAKPTEDGWYLIQNSEKCIQPFTVMLFEEDNFYVMRDDELVRLEIPVMAWARLEHPDSHAWLKLDDFRDIGLIDAHEENMSH